MDAAELLDRAAELGIGDPVDDLERQWEPFSLEALAGKHEQQLAFMRDLSPWIHVMCARQSGKTWGDNGILLDNALSAPNSTGLFLGLKGTAVYVSVWTTVWKPLCARFGIPDDWHNETRMMTTFPNGARVMFAGTDDLSNVKKFLGNRLDHGVVIIDESQDQTDQILKYLLTNLLPPMLTPTSRVIVSGVLPDVEAGYFYELSKAPGWAHHEWGRAANIHTPEAMEQLRAYMKLHNLTEDDPQIARDWFMRRVWDPKALAYHYSAERNGYVHVVPEWFTYEIDQIKVPCGRVMAAEPWDGVDTFAFAIDPGTVDRVSIQGWGWGRKVKRVQHVFDWTSDRNARLTWGKFMPIAALAQRHYGSGGRITWRYDAGSSKNELDTFYTDYRIPVLQAAHKTDLKGQIRRFNDILEESRAAVMIGSTLEEDLQKARRDPTDTPAGPWNWAPQWHPDASEAARYAQQDYFEPITPPPPPVDQRADEKRGFDDERPDQSFFERDAAALGLPVSGLS